MTIPKKLILVALFLGASSCTLSQDSDLRVLPLDPEAATPQKKAKPKALPRKKTCSELSNRSYGRSDSQFVIPCCANPWLLVPSVHFVPEITGSEADRHGIPLARRPPPQERGTLIAELF